MLMLMLHNESSAFTVHLGEEKALICFTCEREDSDSDKKFDSLSGCFSNCLAFRGSSTAELDNVPETEKLEEISNLRAGIATGQK